MNKIYATIITICMIALSVLIVKVAVNPDYMIGDSIKYGTFFGFSTEAEEIT